jgi:hypothetical protein
MRSPVPTIRYRDEPASRSFRMLWLSSLREWANRIRRKGEGTRRTGFPLLGGIRAWRLNARSEFFVWRHALLRLPCLLQMPPTKRACPPGTQRPLDVFQLVQESHGSVQLWAAPLAASGRVGGLSLRVDLVRQRFHPRLFGPPAFFELPRLRFPSPEIRSVYPPSCIINNCAGR